MDGTLKAQMLSLIAVLLGRVINTGPCQAQMSLPTTSPSAVKTRAAMGTQVGYRESGTVWQPLSAGYQHNCQECTAKQKSASNKRVNHV